MNFEYSSFISYRRNEVDKKFLKNFKSIIESEAQKVTNLKNVFFDEDSIEWGNDFNKKIYDSILASFFFIPIYHIGYLHVDNIWCARELYHALEVEKILRNKIGDDSYCYILPIIYRGSTSALPTCICKKKAKEIKQLEPTITSNKSSKGLIDFKHYLYETFLKSFNLLGSKDYSLKDLCADIQIPSDDEIKTWIKEQKEIEKKAESANLPILKKNAE